MKGIWYDKNLVTNSLYRSNFVELASITALFCGLTYLMVYLPLGINIFNEYIGHSEAVFWSNYFWWVDYALSNALNPLVHSYIFFPQGLPMSDGLFPFFLFAPITHFFGATFSYNIYLLSTFVVSGIGMFYLARYLFQDRCTCFVIGLIYAFFPFRFGAAMGHLHTFSSQWVPFFILYYIKLHDTPSFKNVLLASLFFALNALSSWTVTIMIALFCFIFSLVHWRAFFKKDFAKYFFIFILLIVFFSSPGLFLMIKEIIINKHMAKSINSFVYYSADILGFFTPSPLHPFIGDFFRTTYNKFTSNFSENIVFIGYIPMFLAFLGVLHWRREKMVKVLFFSMIFFGMMSLGPVLHVLGRWQFTELKLTVMLPGIFAKYLPGVDMIRVPSRYVILFMVSVALLAGRGLLYLFERLKEKGFTAPLIRMALVCLLSVLISFEYGAVLPTQTVVAIPDIYKTIGKESCSQPILEVPINLLGQSTLEKGPVQTMMYYYEYQKTHKKPFFGGYWSRISEQYSEFLRSNLLLQFLMTGQKDIFKINFEEEMQLLCSKYQIFYLIVHKNLLKKSDFDVVIDTLGEKYGTDFSSPDDPLFIYNMGTFNSLPPERSPMIEPSLGNGWYGLESWRSSDGSNSLPGRWMGKKSYIVVNSDQAQKVHICFRVRSFLKPRKLRISFEDVALLEKEIGTKDMEMLDTVCLLREGVNAIVIDSLDGADRPIDVPKRASRDARSLSFAVQNVSIAPIF